MNLITRDTDYALRALCYIAKQKKGLFSARHLVMELKIPRPFLRKILQKLNSKGILTSYKGKGGGFVLALAADKISVLDLISIFQGPVKLQEHIFKKRGCPNIKTCVLKKKLDAVNRLVISELDSVTVAALCRGM